ncbi:MAG: PIN domain-containing protein [Caldilineaceae bacterium]|nr:PIN domain-containing protein [Caldilineaceae bacterium]HRJ41408.1 PIN domain-containing protein [Caldilineaceae bacterium]
MGTLLDRIAGRSRIGLDSSPFIYYFERSPDWYSIVSDLFVQSVTAPDSIRLYTSGITLAEVLVMPIRTQQQALYNHYIAFFLNSTSVEVIDVSNSVLLLAAALRARHSLRTADVIQISSCLEAGCEVFITNDKRLQKVTEIDVIVLADCDPSPQPNE